MSFTPFGQVLQMQGGNLQAKVGSVFAEKLKIIHALEGGNVSPQMLTGLLGSSGLASIMQNPLSAVAGQLGITDALNNLQTQLGILLPQAQALVSGGAPLYPLTTAALQAASTAASSLLANVQGLAGTAAPAPYGPLDWIMHYNTVGNVGDVQPALAFSAAVAPLLPATVPIVTAAETLIVAQVSSLLQGGAQGYDSVVAAQVNGQVSNVAAIQSTSTAAISGLQNVIATIASAQALAALSLSDDPVMTALLTSIMQPAALSALSTQAAEEFYVAPPTITTLAPLVNQRSSALQWVLGLMGLGAAPTSDEEVE